MSRYLGWNEEKTFEADAGRRLFEEFARLFIKDGWRDKFVKGFNGKGVDERSLKDYVFNGDPKTLSLEELLGCEVPASIEVEEINSLNDPIVTWKRGRPSVARWLFQGDGDAIARASFSYKVFYLFLPHDAYAIYRFPH